MRIVVSDTGMIWNPHNPYLEKYRDDVLCVYLEGTGKYSDRYESFTSGWRSRIRSFRGMADTQRLTDCWMYDELQRRSGRLAEKLEDDEDILFLTDAAPSTLYPYHAVKDKLKYSNLHLVTMSPWSFMGRKQCRNHRDLLQDLTHLKSLLYIESDKELPLEEGQNFDILLKTAEEYMGAQLRIVEHEIKCMDSGKHYYDFNAGRYIPVDEGYEEAISVTRGRGYYPLTKGLLVMGEGSFDYGLSGDKDDVEALTPRIDGKEICEKLREKRIELARLNGIFFESEECPSDGACAGTCPKCDEESAYLRDELAKIPAEKRRYPEIIVGDGEIR